VNDTLPTEIGSLSRLQVLQLVDMENLRGGIPSEFQNLSSLTQLNIARSMYDEISFSSFLTSLPTTLVSLELESCGFQGSISQHIAAFQNMTTLKLVNLNSITGTIPSEIGLMTRLQRIELENLIIHSMVPSEIGKLTKLTYLSLQDSRVTTILPSEIMQLKGLQIIPPGGNM
jgi:Leucine-rich repeat (LRR) protein